MNVFETKYTLKNLPPRQSIMLTGKHGIGKSSVVAQCVLEMSKETGKVYELIDIRLSQRETGDIIGMPTFKDKLTMTHTVFQNGVKVEENVTKENVTVFNSPTWFPTDPDSHGILLLDEINRAPNEVQQAAFELVLDYRLNMKDVPEGWRVVSAINDDATTYKVSEMDPALWDRFLIIPLEPTADEWLSYAEECKVHDAVTKFITKFPENLDPPEELQPGVVYPSRRSWFFLSNTLRHMQTLGRDLVRYKTNEDKKYCLKLMGGYIGTTLAIKFLDFIDKDYKVYTAEQILNDPDPKIIKSILKLNTLDLSYYNKLLTKEIKEKGLNPNQYKNLTRYYKGMEKEAAADLWVSLIAADKKSVIKWYNAEKLQDFTLDIYSDKTKAMLKEGKEEKDESKGGS